MRVACIGRCDDLGEDTPEVVILPEYVSGADIADVAQRFAASIIVGAVRDGTYSRGVLLHAGHNRINYRKRGTDGYTRGSGVCPRPLPVYEYGDVCIGVVICMDVQDGEILRPVADRLRASNCAHKILCIPAAMQSFWFSQTELGPDFVGFHTALSNHPTFHQARCASFVADPTGLKICVQVRYEALQIAVATNSV